MNRLPSHQETLQYLELAQRSAGMGYISLDPATMQLTFSTWVRELIGLEEAVLPIERVAEFVVPEERERLMQQIAQIVDRRGPFEFETVAIRHDSMPTHIRIAGNAIFSGKDLTAFYAIAQDVEGFRRAEAEARASAQQAEAELASSARVMATLSHEIRTPLTGIIGIIEQLRREPRAEERARGLTLIEQSTEALLATLDGVLRGARARSVGNAHEQQVFAPLAVARRVADLFRPVARRKGLSLMIEDGDDVPPLRCIGHAALLQQILSNLVSNAIKFTAAGSVQLTCHPPRAPDAPWRFVVCDTGIGIPPDRLRGLFTAFGSSRPDSLGRHTGAGLGLSLTKQFVDAMGGTLTVESEANVGTTFVVEIRMQPERALTPSQLTDGVLWYACSSASRGIVVSAVAEDAGLSVRAMGPDEFQADEVGAVLVCDDALLAALPDAVRERFSNVIEICEGDDAILMDGGLSPKHIRIAAARLSGDLKQALARIAVA